MLSARRLGERKEFRRRFLAELGEPVELSTVRTLRAVERPGEEDVSVGVVAARLAVDPSTASRLVERAVDAGYLARRPAPEDRRRAQLDLTSTGKEPLERSTRVHRALLAETIRDWSDDEIRTFRGAAALAVGRQP